VEFSEGRLLASWIASKRTGSSWPRRMPSCGLCAELQQGGRRSRKEIRARSSLSPSAGLEAFRAAATIRTHVNFAMLSSPRLENRGDGWGAVAHLFGCDE